MSWEETLRTVVRKYYRSGVVDPPSWVTEQRESRPEPITVSNATCGDRVVVYLESLHPGMERTGRMWLDVAGCAICKASAEMVASAADRLSPPELIEFAHEMTTWLQGTEQSATEQSAVQDDSPPTLPSDAIPAEDLEAILMVREIPGRRRCASLPWEAVLRAVDGSR